MIFVLMYVGISEYEYDLCVLNVLSRDFLLMYGGSSACAFSR